MKMIFKIFLITALLFTMVFTSFQPVSANTNLTTTDIKETKEGKVKIQKDDAIKIVMSKINIPANYKLNNVNFYSNDNPAQSTWSLNWILEKDGQNFGSINVTINAENGELTYIDSYRTTSSYTYYPAEVSLTEAKIIADNYIKDLYPELLNTIAVDQAYLENYKPTLNGAINYYFPYRYLVNGIPLADANSYVSVNGKGEVTNFHFSFPGEMEYESSENIITLDEAKKQYSNLMNMNLIYMFTYRDYDVNSVPYVTFKSSLNQNMISAKTGEVFYYPYQYQESANYQPLVEKPLADPPIDLEKEFSEEEALKIAYDYLKTFTDKKIEFKNIYYNSNYYVNNRSVWELNWNNEPKNNEKYEYLSITIDARNGELIRYSSNDYVIYVEKKNEQNFTQDFKITYDQAKELAIKSVKTYAPAKAHELFIQENNNYNDYQKESDVVYFTFYRLVHGIITERDNIRVGINLKTGEITEYSLNWGFGKYPEEKPSIIDIDQAKEIIINGLELELVYAIPYYKEDNIKKGILIYKPQNQYSANKFLDAVSGQWRSNQDGSIIQTLVPEDIIGHEAEKELQLMVDYRALDLIDGNVMPEKTLTRGELVKMFLLASSGGEYYPYVDKNTQTFKDVASESQYFVYIEDAVRQNLISVNETKEFKPDEPVTREELAQFIVKALGYDKLAQTDGLFIAKYSDQKRSKYSGQISIVSSLGIMEGSGNYFYPNKKVTRADAAISFYNYLLIRNNYQESKNGYYY